MAFDLTSIAKTLLGNDSLTGIAKASGVSTSDVTSVLASALPSLLNGASKQSTGKTTAASFAQALADHSKSKTTDLASFFKNVDAEDGGKIIAHLLGTKGSENTAKKVAKESGVDAEKVIKILSVAAPLLLSLLGKKTKTQQKKETNSTTASLLGALMGNSDLTSILGKLVK